VEKIPEPTPKQLEEKYDQERDTEEAPEEKDLPPGRIGDQIAYLTYTT
jgi:hypothetical protein